MVVGSCNDSQSEGWSSIFTIASCLNERSRFGDLGLLVVVHTAFVVPMNASSAKATMNVMST
jgi:hypothetical protein